MSSKILGKTKGISRSVKIQKNAGILKGYTQ